MGSDRASLLKPVGPPLLRALAFTRRLAAVLAFAAPAVMFATASAMWGSLQSQMDMATWQFALSSLTTCGSALLSACRFGVTFGFLWFFAGYFEAVLTARTERAAQASTGGV